MWRHFLRRTVLASVKRRRRVGLLTERLRTREAGLADRAVRLPRLTVPADGTRLGPGGGRGAELALGAGHAGHQTTEGVEARQAGHPEHTQPPTTLTALVIFFFWFFY